VLGNTNLGANILLFTDGQPNNKARARSIARQIRQAGINLVAVGTGDAKVNYLISLTGDRELVFYANSGEIDNAFRAAERVIYGQQLVESDRSGDYGLVFGIFRIGVWTGWLALGTAIALIVGQNRTLRRRLLTRREGLVGGGGGFLAGFTGGAVGQFAFLPTVYLPALSLVARLTGWTLLGTLVGGGMSLFVPNLPRDKALMAGAIGGILGAIGFLLLDAVVGVVLGRLAGAAIRVNLTAVPPENRPSLSGRGNASIAPPVWRRGGYRQALSEGLRTTITSLADTIKQHRDFRKHFITNRTVFGNCSGKSRSTQRSHSLFQGAFPPGRERKW
jgi:Ca-activated chloride channel family protein